MEMVNGDYQEQMVHGGMEQQGYYDPGVGPYQGYGESDGEDDDMGMMHMEDGDYSMDAYGDTGYLNQQYFNDDYADPDI